MCLTLRWWVILAEWEYHFIDQQHRVGEVTIILYFLLLLVPCTLWYPSYDLVVSFVHIIFLLISEALNKITIHFARKIDICGVLHGDLTRKYIPYVILNEFCLQLIKFCKIFIKDGQETPSKEKNLILWYHEAISEPLTSLKKRCCRINKLPFLLPTLS